jgi:DNA-binding NtrC family response regulator
MRVPVTDDSPLVVIVDDECIVCEMLELLFQQSGFQTRAFFDPEQLLDTLDTKDSPQILVTDYFMPNLNGLELMSRSRELWPGIRTVLISGGPMLAELHDDATRPERFIRKPFAPDELLNSVTQLLKGNAVATGMAIP